MNRRLPRFFFLGFLSLLLFACQQEPETTPVVEPDPTPSALPTPLPPTPSTQPTFTHTAQPSPTIEATATASIVVTPTPTATSLPITVPYTPGFTAYQLHPPSAEALLNVFRQIVHERMLENANDLDIYYLGEFIRADLQKYIPSGFPDAMTWLTDGSLAEPYPYWYMPTVAHSHVLMDGFLQVVQQTQYQFESDLTEEWEGVSFTPFALELDGDSLPEWVVLVDFPVWAHRSVVFLDETEPGHYQPLPTKLPDFLGPWYPDSITTVDVSHDFTNDDVKEVVIYDEASLLGGGTGATLWIYTWETSQLVLLQEIDLTYGYPWLAPVLELADYTGDGVEDIRVQTPYVRELGCEWEATDLYSWNGLEPQFVLEMDSYPDIPLCHVYRSIFSFRSQLTIAERIALLERAIDQFSTEPAPSVDFLAFIYFHLAMLYTTEGQDDLARQRLDALYELSPDAYLVKLYTEIYESTNHSPLATCRQLLQRAPEVMESEMADYVSQLAILGVGGDETKPVARLVCPLGDVVRGRVATLSPLQTTNPVSTLVNLGYSLAFTQTTNLDTDPELEWMGILEPIAPSLIIFDQTPAGWMIYQPGSYSFDEVVALTWLLRDLTGDGIDDVLVLLQLKGTHFGGFSSPYQVYFIDISSGTYNILDVVYPYDEVMLAEIGLDYFDIGQPARSWRQLEGFPTEATYIDEYVRELVAAVLSPEHSATLPEDLIALINYLPQDDPDAYYLILQLTYMLGYTYEQEGRDEEAMATYLALIQQAPESPWSWLAWARIEPEE